VLLKSIDSGIDSVIMYILACLNYLLWTIFFSFFDSLRKKVIHLRTGTSMPSQFLQEWYGSFSFPSGIFELPTNNYGTYDSSIFQSRGVLAEAQYSQNVMRVGRHPWNHLFHFLEITLLLRLAWESFLICNNTWSEHLLLYRLQLFSTTRCD